MGFGNFNDMVRAAKASGKNKRCAVVAAESKLALEPVLSVYKDGLIEPILIGNSRLILDYVTELGGTAGEFTIISVANPKEAAQKAVDLVNEGRADSIMKGHIETSSLLSVLLRRGNGMLAGRILSAVGMFEMPSYHKLLVHSDGGVNLFPDLAQKKLILENALWVLRKKLGIECPKVAVLAAVEVVNPKIPATVDARALKEMNQRGEMEHCIVEGPMSYDLAISKDAAKAKGFDSPVAGDADLLIWPDINSGNLASKALNFSVGAKEANLVVGAKVPIIIPSRFQPLEDRYRSLILTTLEDWEDTHSPHQKSDRNVWRSEA
jgi:phosphate butyryltransferase